MHQAFQKAQHLIPASFPSGRKLGHFHGNHGANVHALALLKMLWKCFPSLVTSSPNVAGVPLVLLGCSLEEKLKHFEFCNPQVKRRGV
jgi:hypothetical protein